MEILENSGIYRQESVLYLIEVYYQLFLNDLPTSPWSGLVSNIFVANFDGEVSRWLGGRFIKPIQQPSHDHSPIWYRLLGFFPRLDCVRCLSRLRGLRFSCFQHRSDCHVFLMSAVAYGILVPGEVCALRLGDGDELLFDVVRETLVANSPALALHLCLLSFPVCS